MRAFRFLRALPLALLLIAPARADQASIVGPTSGPKTMTDVMTALNAALLAIQSCNSGTSAPANGVASAPTAHQCWADTSGAPTVTYKRYDGASWVTFGTLNTTTHVWTPYRNGAPIVAVATSGSAADLTTGTLPAARMPTPSATTLGGVQSRTCSASQWLTEITTSGVPNCAQPNFTDIAGTASLAQIPAFSGMSAATAAADADTFPTNQGAGNLKQSLAAIKTWIKAWVVKADVGLGNVDNTSDTTKWGATKTLTNTTYNCGSTGNVCTVRLGSDITGFGTGVATALGVNIGAAGAPVLFNGAGGTPSSIILTNATGTAAGLTAGNVQTNANLTGEVTSVGNATTVTNSSVIGKLLTSFSASAGTVSSSDSILAAIQKIVGNIALKADLSGPTFTGVPRAPTASPSNNSTQLATTAYVDAQVAGGVAGVGSIDALTGIFTTANGVKSTGKVLQLDGAFGYRNRLINPSGQVNQAGSGTAADNTYWFDQWVVLTQSNPITPSQLAGAENGTPYAMRYTQSNASAQRFGVSQPIENANIADARGATVSLSARVRMSSATTLRYAIVEWTGTADAPTRDVVNDWTSATLTPGNFFISGNTTICGTGSTALAANTFTTISASCTVSGSMTNLHAFFWTDSTQAQNVTLDIARAQLEIGDKPTALAFRDIATETSLAQRYMYVMSSAAGGTFAPFGTGVIFSNSIAIGWAIFPVTMLKVPSLTVSAASDFQLLPNPGTAPSAIALDFGTMNGATINFTVSGQTPAQSFWYRAVNSNARMFFSARL